MPHSFSIECCACRSSCIVSWLYCLLHQCDSHPPDIVKTSTLYLQSCVHWKMRKHDMSALKVVLWDSLSNITSNYKASPNPKIFQFLQVVTSSSSSIPSYSLEFSPHHLILVHQRSVQPWLITRHNLCTIQECFDGPDTPPFSVLFVLQVTIAVVEAWERG